MTKIGPWTVNQTHIAYENPWVRMEHNDVTRPDGKPGVYGVIRFQNRAIGILPLFDDGTVPMVGQHRFPFDAYSWELPEGGGPKGEEPIETARRELLEETGLTAENLLEYGSCTLSNCVSDEVAHYFLAWGLTQGQACPDPDEVLDYKRVPFAQLARECLNGTITDSLTILLVQTAILKAQGGELPPGPSDLILGAMAQTR